MANSNMFFPIPVFGRKKCGKSGGIVTRKDSCNKICVSGNCFVFASDTCLMFALASSGVVMYCTGKISVVVPVMMMMMMTVTPSQACPNYKRGIRAFHRSLAGSEIFQNETIICLHMEMPVPPKIILQIGSEWQSHSDSDDDGPLPVAVGFASHVTLGEPQLRIVKDLRDLRVLFQICVLILLQAARRDPSMPECKKHCGRSSLRRKALPDLQ
jgi:hypothetical protein